MGQPVTNWQILSPQPDRTEAFYSALFGWRITRDNPLAVREVSTESGRGIPGGIWPAPPGATSFVQLFVEVEDVGACVAQAQALGASVLVPPQKLPAGEEMAVLRDPLGLTFGLVHRMS